MLGLAVAPLGVWAVGRDGRDGRGGSGRGAIQGHATLEHVAGEVVGVVRFTNVRLLGLAVVWIPQATYVHGWLEKYSMHSEGGRPKRRWIEPVCVCWRARAKSRKEAERRRDGKTESQKRRDGKTKRRRNGETER